VVRDDILGVDRRIPHRCIHCGVAADLGGDMRGQPGADGVGDEDPQVGLLQLHCQTLLDPDQSQALVVYTASPGSESYEKLQLLSVIGDQRV